MKSILRKTLLNSLSLWLTSLATPGGLVIAGGIVTLILAGLVLLLLQKLLKPILQVLTLPLNLLTFGLFSWVINIITLYLLTLFVLGIKVSSFTFSGADFAGFIIPKMEFNQLTAFVVVSLTLTVIQKVLQWVIER